MAGKGLDIPAEEIERELPKPGRNTGDKNLESNGFGLVVWLFDHINERRPIFLSLYRSYDNEVKLSSNYPLTSLILLFFAIIGDLAIFLVYALAVIAIIAGITFIFVKGTGLLDYINSLHI